MKFISPTEMLAQDDSLPGNRGGRFRFDHLLVPMVATPLYLWLELSFGVTLLDNIGSQVIAENTAAIEHWGRLISGVAVALLAWSGWLEQCEKYAVGWFKRFLGGSFIVAASIALNWWLQSVIIDFYVQHSAQGLITGLRWLGLITILALIAMAWQVRTARRHQHAARTRVLIVLGIFIAAVHLAVTFIFVPGPEEIKARGVERQQAAYMTIVRRAVEQGVYELPGVKNAGGIYETAEGKTFMALLPAIGSSIPEESAAIVKDRERIIFELLLSEWRGSYGAASFPAYQRLQDDFRRAYDTAYKPASRAYMQTLKSHNKALADREWRNHVLPELHGAAPSPGLSWDGFQHDPSVIAVLRQEFGCLDCQFSLDMNQSRFERELFTRTQGDKVNQLLERLSDPQNFESGSDGERAARTYWVPIWSLLFSMLGAFTHIFKLIFLFTEYAHLRNFHRIKAADSLLAARVIKTSRIATAMVVFGMVLVIYFSENRVTGHRSYIEPRPAVWQKHPVTGGIVVHWTINAQAIIYPITRKLKPDWLRFDSDPLALVGLKKGFGDEG